MDQLSDGLFRVVGVAWTFRNLLQQLPGSSCMESRPDHEVDAPQKLRSTQVGESARKSGWKPFTNLIELAQDRFYLVAGLAVDPADKAANLLYSASMALLPSDSSLRSIAY